MEKGTKLYKAESNINGLGVFAGENFKSGEELYTVPTESLSHSPRPRWAHIGGGTFVSDGDVLNFVNHSCEPSAEMVLKPKVLLKSLRVIAKGDEITVDYNKTEKGGTEVPCSCNSNKCKEYFLRIENLAE